ncbi:hypothetical protein, partial [Thermus sp.]|uniref:hypothetical protein n=1 Tax=Thermus sp. TaxID=275 RepID=UPI003919360E
MAKKVRRNPLTGKHLVQHEVYGGLYSSIARCRNPLTGKHLVQQYPPKNIVLDRTFRGGFCEKHEAWNIHMA